MLLSIIGAVLLNAIVVFAILVNNERSKADELIRLVIQCELVVIGIGAVAAASMGSGLVWYIVGAGLPSVVAGVLMSAFSVPDHC